MTEEAQKNHLQDVLAKVRAIVEKELPDCVYTLVIGQEIEGVEETYAAGCSNLEEADAIELVEWAMGGHDVPATAH